MNDEKCSSGPYIWSSRDEVEVRGTAAAAAAAAAAGSHVLCTFSSVLVELSVQTVTSFC